MKKYFLIGLLGIILLFSACSGDNVNNMPLIVDGKGNFSSWNFEKDGNLELKGDWELYWKKIVPVEDFKAGKAPKSSLAYVPGFWTAVGDSSLNVTGSGYATYRVTLTMPGKNTNYIFHSRGQGTACVAYANGVYVGENGKLGLTEETNIPGLESFESIVTSDENAQIEFVYHVANFHHRGGGVWSKVYIGTKKNVLDASNAEKVEILIIAGILLVMAFYHFILFFLHRSRVSTLAFALLALSMFIRVLMVNDRYLLYIFPDLDFFIHFKIEYLTAFSGGILVPWFLYELFKEDFPKLAFRIMLGLGIGIDLFIIFTPLSVYSKFLLIYNAIIFSGVMYIFFYVQVKAIINKRHGAIIAFIGIFIFYGTGTHDMLKAIELINTPNFLAHYGFALYIISQSYVIASRFSKAFKQNKKLTTTLDYQNKNLENIVEERTVEINQQKEELQVQAENLLENNQMISEKNEELQQQNEEINSQKEEIENQKAKLDAHHESLQSSIRYAETIQRAMLPSDERINEFFDSEIIFMPKNVVSGDFYWYMVQPAENGNPAKAYAAVIDCTGHGVPGAFMSMIGNRILNNLVRQQKLTSPAEILTKLDEGVYRTLNQKESENNDGMDLTLCQLVLQENGETKVTFCAAKQAVYVVPKGGKKPSRHKGDRKSIGGNRNTKVFTDKSFVLQKGDRLFMMSDGFADQNAPDRSKIGSLKTANEFSNSANLSLKEQKQKLLDMFEEHRQGQPLRDDISLWGIQIR